MDRWPHQIRAVEETLAAIAAGQRKICLCSPTGGGKTVVASDLIQHYLEQERAVSLYTNRRLLVDQTSRVLTAAGFDHGVRASGHEQNLDRLLQVSSIQTEDSRVNKKGIWKPHESELVIVDEAHLNKKGFAEQLLAHHHSRGAAIVGLTATPLGIGHLYDHLIVAGTTSELRDCHALLPCHHYGPEEPDLRHIGRVAVGEDLTEKQQKKAMGSVNEPERLYRLFGRVLEEWLEKNPEQLPTILFAPGVPESLWFAQEFWKKGISAAHIDGQEVWHDGRTYRRTHGEDDPVKDILAGSKDGSIKVLCNRFVLREGIDAPWLAWGIMATVFGSLQTFLQSGGRLLRFFEGLDYVGLLDFGGNWWRHGSLNADREWNLEYTPDMVAGLRQERLRAKKEREPFWCPECNRILNGIKCPCGFVLDPTKKTRPVVQVDGSLKYMHGDIFKARQICKKTNGAKLWESMYHRSKTDKGDRTFRAAMALFAQENNWKYPDPSWPLMPTNETDLFRHVRDVPREGLT